MQGRLEIETKVNSYHYYGDSDVELVLLLDQLIIRLVSKEKELKTAFRGFGCQTYKERTCTMVAGKNAMQFLANTCDEQALTLDELSMTKKIYSFLNLKDLYKNHRVFYVNFDASGWNMKFIHGTVAPVMKETVDPVTGVKIMQFTHDGYENVMIIIPDEKYMIWWKRQYGGVEGLSQPVWQIVYSGQIHTSFDGSGYTVYILLIHQG